MGPHSETITFITLFYARSKLFGGATCCYCLFPAPWLHQEQTAVGLVSDGI